MAREGNFYKVPFPGLSPHNFLAGFYLVNKTPVWYIES